MSQRPGTPVRAVESPAALIETLEQRFHEGHRRDLPRLVAQARPVSAALADHLQAMARALELHMFKEEARLFPTLLQGGHSLAGLLMDDLRREHRAHEEAVGTLLALMAREPLPDALCAALQHFVAELAEHVRLEDERLFPLFPRDPSARPIA